MNIETDNLLARINSLVPQSDTYSSQKAKSAQELQGDSFSSILQKEISKQDGLTFSKHAEARMVQRDMTLSGTEMQRLSEGVDKASEKGVSNTLVLMDEKAFIVNVPNNVVITAMNGQDLKENVFTNIDGAVIV
jgi:flagellar operon protein